MGAVKEFYMECAESGLVPLSEEQSWDDLYAAEKELDLDWINEIENSFQDRAGFYFVVAGIDVKTAIRLRDIGVNIDESNAFLELFVDPRGGK